MYLNIFKYHVYKTIRDPDVAKSEAKTGIHVILPSQEMQKLGQPKATIVAMDNDEKRWKHGLVIEFHDNR